MKDTELCKKILKLRQSGKTYNQIAETLNCSKGTVSYYCGQNQKNKNLSRQRRARSKQHPYQRKIEYFKGRDNKYQPRKDSQQSTTQKLRIKVYSFHNPSRNKQMRKEDLNFTVEDVINKIGDNPRCYLTGIPINIDDTKSYQFDHVIPVSRGGTNTLDNLEIASKQANQAKGDMTPDEFRNLCKLVIKNSEDRNRTGVPIKDTGL